MLLTYFAFYFVQSQYSYAVVESLMSHLDENSGSSARIRTSITHVLSKIISISAEESVGMLSLRSLVYYVFTACYLKNDIAKY